MAIGDGTDATAAGMAAVIGSATQANTIDTEITKTRDWLANGPTYWKPGIVCSIPRGGTGADTAAGARTALGIAATKTDVDDATATATEGKLVRWGNGGRLNIVTPLAGANPATKQYVDDGLSQKAENDAFGEVQAGFLSSAVYNRDITYGRRSCWVGSDGALGFASSSRYKKQNITPAELTLEQLRSIPVVLYRYRAAVAKERKGGPKAPVEIGTIAQDVDALGLWQFVQYDDGKPVGIHYELLSLAALSLAQQLADRLDTFEARLAALEGTP